MAAGEDVLVVAGVDELSGTALEVAPAEAAT